MAGGRIKKKRIKALISNNVLIEKAEKSLPRSQAANSKTDIMARGTMSKLFQYVLREAF